MSDDEIVIPEGGISPFERRTQPPQHRIQPCGCHHCVAMDRLYALAAVFEETGDYSLADVISNLAERAGRKDPQGRQMALSILYGTGDWIIYGRKD